MTARSESELEHFEAVTRAIRVRVAPDYLPDQSDPDASHYFWAYHIEVSNEGDETVQLKSRRWRITDCNGVTKEVEGPGVVGEQPILGPGDAFCYASGCPLTTPSGFMVGSYVMQTAEGERFDIAIPAFPLDLPGARSRIN